MSKNNLKADLDRTVSLACSAFGRLRSPFKLDISNIINARMFDQYVLPLLAYGSETWALNRSIINKLQVIQENKCQTINTYLDGRRSTESWKTLKSLRTDAKQDLIFLISLEVWDKYFSVLLQEDRMQFLTEEQTQNIRVEASLIRIKPKEIKQICISLKNNKALGPGNIPTELIKYGTENILEYLRTLLCLSGRELPTEFKTSVISTILKKGIKANTTTIEELP